ncbi:hypothetical protein ADL00_41155 [Streptomyces sp. AS58]|nr:hypothetical protein ADL00_41155 [Streptomyces sp. AS58]
MWERCRGLLDCCSVQLAELLVEQMKRPAVYRGVMDGYSQDRVCLVQFEQSRPQQWRLVQWHVHRDRGGQCLLQVRRCYSLSYEWNGGSRRDYLTWLSVDESQLASQGFVPPHNGVQGTLHSPHVNGTAQVMGPRLHVARRSIAELLDKPYPLLLECHRIHQRCH